MPYILAIPIIAVIMKRCFQFNGPVKRGAALAQPRLRRAGLDRLVRWSALWTVMMLIIWRESALGIILFLARM
jgi:hypothetical protein